LSKIFSGKAQNIDDAIHPMSIIITSMGCVSLLAHCPCFPRVAIPILYFPIGLDVGSTLAQFWVILNGFD